MKEIIINLNGQGNLYDVETILDMDSVDLDCDVFQLEDDDITDCDTLQEVCVILDHVQVIANGVDITKKKGKYIKRKDYYSKTIANPSFATRMMCDFEIEEEFHITLNDDEEFDPSKLQLVKTDYELDFIPYGILTSCIVYDGKEIHSEGKATDGVWHDRHRESYIIDYDLPYVK